MLKCVDTKSVEYQSLKDKAGVPDYLLETMCRRFMTDYGRLPHLDEIPNSNSEPYLREQLVIRENNGVSINKVLELTGTTNLKDAIIKLNDQFRDLEIDMAPIVNDAIVDITHKPTNDYKENEPIEPDKNVDSVEVFNRSIKKLANLYGIGFKAVTEAELNTEQWRNLVPDASVTNAFIYGGDIYINVDRNSVDAPLHEMMHIFIGSLRFSNPELYQQLVNSAMQLPNYQEIYDSFKIGNDRRTQNDINEEIFVQEMAKNLVGISDTFNNLDDATKYEINYNLKRMLDIVLMGDDSVKIIPDEQIYTMSLKEIAQYVNSAIMNNVSLFGINTQDAELHRKLNNIKSDLFTRGILEEVCL